MSQDTDTNINEDSLTPIVIDLHAGNRGELDESFLAGFGGAIKMLLGRMFGGYSPPVKLRGTRRELDSFAQALENERDYLKAVKKYGLDDKRTWANRYKMQSAVKGFERDTKIKWPFEL